jgi:hypothetical protein
VEKMPTYRLKLRKFRVDVFVPSEVKGLRAVADYITRDQARKYAQALANVVPDETPEEIRKERLKALEQNWYDSHFDVIVELLKDYRDKLRWKHGRK